ncbi:6-hydroxymethylpterin diphosphokinase MptE-like protein [Neptunicoccus cionae]|uniref:6-hydroxymethylpterin diphosphokinase MptE-like domain-containing protein n=1 Tax=Neptunicoccus cionae TaxID=2035344 RepID=A0A916R2A2_9RHOB|nr:6-hydroxymethylpterin diphosphokinase MptE-like protein [Amylibacter cionae]GGA29224.1 hypothetical protein GCM10011498_32970 [Amylibacter cionae]
MVQSCPRLPRFKNRHIGETCVLVCNGPSLNKMDLEPLKHQTVIGLNKIHLGVEKFGFYPKYLVAVNEKVIGQSAQDIAAMNCVKFISNKGAQHVPADALTYHINTKSPPARFCRDITAGIREGGTVTYAALQIAYFMGFARVVIIGMDHRFDFSGKPHEAHHMKGPDVNHFSPAYFSGQTWDNPDLQRSEESYRIAREIFAAEGREIIDATLDGGCEIFVKHQLSDILGG